MDLRGNQPKHLLCSLLQGASKHTLPVNSLAQTLQVTHPKCLLSQVMECPQLLKLVMGLNRLLNLHMGLDMEHHLKRKSLLLSHPPLLVAMVNHQLCIQAIPILSLHLPDMLSLILVHVSHHPVMVLQLLRQAMVAPQLMVHRLLVSQVMGRHHPTIHLMGLQDTHSLLHILLKERMETLVVGHMMLLVLVLLLHRLLSQVELPRRPHRVKSGF